MIGVTVKKSDDLLLRLAVIFDASARVLETDRAIDRQTDRRNGPV